MSETANLGLATTRELLDELRARIEVDHAQGGGGLDYTTVGGRPASPAVSLPGERPDGCAFCRGGPRTEPPDLSAYYVDEDDDEPPSLPGEQPGGDCIEAALAIPFKPEAAADPERRLAGWIAGYNEALTVVRAALTAPALPVERADEEKP